MVRCYALIVALLLVLLPNDNNTNNYVVHGFMTTSRSSTTRTAATMVDDGCLLLSLSSSSVRQHQPQRQKRRHRHGITSYSTTATSLQLSSSITSFIPKTPLIGAHDTWGNVASLLSIASISQVLGLRTTVGKALGAPVTAMAISFVLASIGVLNSGGTQAAKSLQMLSLQLATPLVLLGADFTNARQRCGPLLISFTVASISTIIACIVGYNIAGPSLISNLGMDGLKLCAALLAKNVGGGINYIAVCTSLQASSTAIAAGLCIDNIFALIYFPISSYLASKYTDVIENENNGDNVTGSATVGLIEEEDLVKSSTGDGDGTAAAVDEGNSSDGGGDSSASLSSTTISVQNVSNALCISAGLIWLGEKVGGKIMAALPMTTLFTVLLVVSASASASSSSSSSSRTTRQQGNFVQQSRPAASCLGTFCLYVFFATAGSPGMAVADSVQSALLPLSVFLTCLYSIHGLILWAFHRLLRRRACAAAAPQRLLVASSAAIGGPATAVALAETAKWDSMVVPSLLVGNVGYAIATFCGLLYYYTLL